MATKRKKVFIILGSAFVILCIIAGIIIYTGHNAPPNLVVSGIVKDAKTGEPIQGAKVSDGQYASGKFFDMTDSTGRYLYLTYPEEHSIVVEVRGYKTQSQLLTTKLFNEKKEKIFDFMLERD